MAAITGRHTSLEDVKAVIIDGTDAVALFTSLTLDFTADEIDVTSLTDSWKKREYGTRDWSMRLSSLIHTTPKFIDTFISGGVVVVSVSATGFTMSASAMLPSNSLAYENPAKEDITVMSAGEAPVVTIAS